MIPEPPKKLEKENIKDKAKQHVNVLMKSLVNKNPEVTEKSFPNPGEKQVIVQPAGSNYE